MRTFSTLLALSFAIASLGSLATTSMGCSLIVQFDRDRIMEAGVDGGVDAPMTADAGRDTPMSDTPMTDTPMLDVPMSDTPELDAPVMDVPMLDVPMLDVPADVPADVPPDSPDAPVMMDAGTDAPTQCSDGVDNDGDGTTDLMDPGCADAADNDEGGACPAGGATCPACNNSTDDDFDGNIDFPMDMQCTSAADNDEMM